MRIQRTAFVAGIAVLAVIAAFAAIPGGRAQEEEEENRRRTEAADALKASVELGNGLFHDAKLGTKERACAKCHEDEEKPKLDLSRLVDTYPKWDRRERKVITLGQKINQMIDRMLAGQRLSLGSEKIVALEAYLISLARKAE